MTKLHCLYCGSENIEPVDNFLKGKKSIQYYCNNCQKYLNEEEIVEE